MGHLHCHIYGPGGPGYTVCTSNMLESRTAGLALSNYLKGSQVAQILETIHPHPGGDPGFPFTSSSHFLEDEVTSSPRGKLRLGPTSCEPSTTPEILWQVEFVSLGDHQGNVHAEAALAGFDALIHKVFVGSSPRSSLHVADHPDH